MAESLPTRHVAGILLTGGSSRRMGLDKASMPIDGVACAVRIARVLRRVVADAVEVGPGVSGLPSVREKAPGNGPLVALCAGVEALEVAGSSVAALLLACDLPFVTDSVLATLASWPGRHSVVPVVHGQPQTLCARWSTDELAEAPRLVASGHRSMGSLLARPGVELVDERAWPEPLDPRVLADIDTPADLERLGLVAGTADSRTCVSPEERRHG